MNIVYIILGWLLGLLSPRIVELILRPYRRTQIQESLFIELLEVRRNLAATAFQVFESRGRIDRAFLTWLGPMMGADRHRYSEAPIVERIEAVLQYNDQQLAAGFRPHNPRTHITLKKRSLPFLTSQITSLNLFSTEFQRLALEIRSKLDMANAEIDIAWFNYTKTFDRIPEENYAVVHNNMHNSALNAAEISREICDDITDLLALMGRKKSKRP